MRRTAPPSCATSPTTEISLRTSSLDIEAAPVEGRKERVRPGRRRRGRGSRGGGGGAGGPRAASRRRRWGGGRGGCAGGGGGVDGAPAGKGGGRGSATGREM